jgi:hypothetical protein
LCWLRKILRRFLLPAFLLRTRLRELALQTPGIALPTSGVDDVLFFFYDLQINPVTYDVANQLAIAELERRERGLKFLHLVVVPGRWQLHDFDGYNTAVPPEAVKMRIHQLALPIAQFLRSCKGVTLCASRAEARWMRFAMARHVCPSGYEPDVPERSLPLTRGRAPELHADVFFPMFSANTVARVMVHAFLSERIGGRRPVVITLRQYGFMPSRNSRVADWVAFADGLDASKYAAVFVPDTSQPPNEIDPGVRRHTVCELASWNVGFRMALYELAYVNMSLMHGPMELALYNEVCRYAVFIPLGASPQTEKWILTKRGFLIGRDLPFARPWQRLVWEADDLTAIRRTFADMEAIS